MNLHVYSVHCAWHGPIANVGSLRTPPLVIGKKISTRRELGAHDLPCCPYCESVLCQMEEDEFWASAKRHEAAGHAGYVEFMRWVQDQPRCWRNIHLAGMAYIAATGKPLVLNAPRKRK